MPDLSASLADKVFRAYIRESDGYMESGACHDGLSSSLRKKSRRKRYVLLCMSYEASTVSA